MRDAQTPRDRNVPATTFDVQGLCCAEEVRQIEDKLGGTPGIERLRFDLVRRRLMVDGTVRPSVVKRALAELGMTAHAEGEERSLPSFWEQHGRTVTTVTSGVLLAVGLAVHFLAAVPWLTVPVLAASGIVAAWFIAPRAWRALRSGSLDMHVLMVAAAIGAAGIGEWAEGAAVLFLFSVAQLLETWSMERSRRAIAALMELTPTEAVVRRHGGEVRVPPEEVAMGEVIVVRPGQKVPLDGAVLSGRSVLDQSPITGESMPVEKEQGDEVFAGSINQHGAIDVRVTRHADDTTLARIIHAVEEAQASRAPTQSFIERFARVYTPAVIGGAVLVFLLPPLLGLGPWSVWFYRALAMLVIACPCALVISTPVSIVSGLAGAAHGGVLVKGGLHLEQLGQVTTVAFDKTGTLTQGNPAVTDVESIDQGSREMVLRLAASLEQGSEHALARAILAKAREEQLALSPVDEFLTMPGRGVRGVVEGRTLALGNERLCREEGMWTPRVEERLRLLEQAGKSAVVLLDDEAPLGVLGIADQVRPTAAPSLAALRSLGLHLVMLTGDNRETARAVARQLGIEDYRAELLPEEKVRIVQEQIDRGELVAFVGDGVNDAPALATATTGVAMGAAGTDVALETADVALMADDLSKIEFAIRMSRKTRAVIKQNVVFSIAVKVVVAALALGGWATLWMAVVADMGSSLAVTVNGLRCRRLSKRGRSTSP